MKKYITILLFFISLKLSAQSGQPGYRMFQKYDSTTHQPLGLDTSRYLYFKNGTYTRAGSANVPDTVTYANSPALTAEYVARGTGSALWGDSSFTHDSTNRFVGMNSKIPAATLDIRAYYGGTVGGTNGSATIAGSGTSFTNDFKAFDSIYINGTGYRILSISNATSLILTTPFGQSTASGLSYIGQFKNFGAFQFMANGEIRQGFDALASTSAPIFRSSTSGGSVGLGYRAIAGYTSGSFLTGVGYSALRSNTTGTNNTAVGYTALQNLTTVSGNTAVGSISLAALSSTGANNTAVGYLSLGVATSGSDNVAIGYNAMGSIASPGSQSVGIGRHAISNTSGNDNAAMGYFAGTYDFSASTVNASCARSVFLGSSTKVAASGQTNAIAIGYGSRTNGSSTATIGSDSITQVNLYGDIQSPIKAPGTPTLSGSSSGGSIAAGTYYYVITANDDNGNTSFRSVQPTGVTTTGSTSSITITFPSLPVGAVSWNIYRTTTSGTYGASSLIASAQTGANYVDGAAATSSGTPGTSTTGFVNKISATSGGSSYINNGGGLGIGTNAPSSKAILDLTSTTKGLLLPRMTKTQRDAISSPPAGLAIYQTDNTPGLRVYNGTNWIKYTESTD